MHITRLIPMAIRTGLLAALLVLIMSFTSFGELVAPTSVNTNMVHAESSHQQNENLARALSSESMGFRSAESEGESTVAPLVPLQRSLSVKKPELVETTDASGGTMIQLQGKFQCGLEGSTRNGWIQLLTPQLAPTIP